MSEKQNIKKIWLGLDEKCKTKSKDQKTVYNLTVYFLHMKISVAKYIFTAYLIIHLSVVIKWGFYQLDRELNQFTLCVLREFEISHKHICVSCYGHGAMGNYMLMISHW